MNSELQIKALAELDRFWSKVKLPHGTTDEDCWEWTGTKFETGYGGFQLQGKLVKAHRLSFTLSRGVIPEGLMVLHRCDCRSCVNPNHLFIGTAKDNTQDMMNKNRHGFTSMTHCSFGHKFDEKNTKIVVMKNGSEWRKCRKCDAIRARERRMGLR